MTRWWHNLFFSFPHKILMLFLWSRRVQNMENCCWFVNLSSKGFLHQYHKVMSLPVCHLTGICLVGSPIIAYYLQNTHQQFGFLFFHFLTWSLNWHIKNTRISFPFSRRYWRNRWCNRNRSRRAGNKTRWQNRLPHWRKWKRWGHVIKSITVRCLETTVWCYARCRMICMYWWRPRMEELFIQRNVLINGHWCKRDSSRFRFRVCIIRISFFPLSKPTLYSSWGIFFILQYHLYHNKEYILYKLQLVLYDTHILLPLNISQTSPFRIM